MAISVSIAISGRTESTRRLAFNLAKFSITHPEHLSNINRTKAREVGLRLKHYDQFARQIKHYDQVGSPKSRGAIVIRLSMILDLSDRLKRYGLAKPTETSDRVLERVRGLVTSYYEAGHNPYNTSDNCYYRNLCRESSIGP